MKELTSLLRAVWCRAFVATSVLAALGLRAAAQAPQVPTVPTTFDKNDLQDVFVGLIDYVLVILGAVAVLVILYSGYLFMTAGGNEKKLQQAKGALKWGIIGIVVAIFAFSAVNLVNNLLTGTFSGATTP